MQTPEPRPNGLARRLWLSRAALAIEHAWSALAPAAGVLVAFLALSLLDVWSWLPGWLHAIGIAAFVAAFGWSVWRTKGALSWPDNDAGLRRMEAINRLSHQPLRLLEDRLSGDERDPGTRLLWQRHRERLLASLSRLRIGPPRSDLPRRDPWAFRAALGLILVIAIFEAGSLAPERLVRAFDFTRPDGSVAVAPEVIVWVTPPTYTGEPPRSLPALQPAAAAPPEGEATAAPALPPRIRVPAGSEVLAQIHHIEPPAGRFIADLGGLRQPFAGTGEGSAEARLEVDRSGELVIGPQEEDPLGTWRIEAIPDLAPSVAFAEPPSATHRAVLRTAVRAEDDYGVVDVTLLMHRPGKSEDVERMELAKPPAGRKEVTDASFLDLTPHPWAGLPVVLRLEAKDAIDQIGRSEALEIVLPARVFEHPLARRLIEERRKLAAAPESRREVAAALNRLSQNPLLYQDDVAVYLALRTSAARLMLGEEVDEGIDEVIDTLWDTALHLEDGNLSVAERQLRELQRALQEALDRGAPTEELEQLLSELERAMQEYLQQLAQQMMNTPQDQMQPVDPDAMQVEQQDLQQMLDMAREMIRTGSLDAAQQMLAQLQQMLENLQMAQQGQQMSQGQQMMSDLQEMIQRQQGLLDETYGMQQEPGQQQGQQGQQGQMGQEGQFGQQQGQQGQRGGQGQGQQPGQGQMGQMAADQEALRRMLGELMQGLGDNGMQIPRSLGEAELSMRAARDALQQGQAGQAVGPQAEALDQLRQGGQAMMEEMQRMMANGQGPMGGRPQGQAGEARDPLGRALFNQGGPDVWGERVPTELDLGRARSILEELYRRAGEQNRPAFELQYLERLLERF